jgi:hypothetical protein
MYYADDPLFFNPPSTIQLASFASTTSFREFSVVISPPAALMILIAPPSLPLTMEYHLRTRRHPSVPAPAENPIPPNSTRDVSPDEQVDELASDEQVDDQAAAQHDEDAPSGSRRKITSPAGRPGSKRRKTDSVPSPNSKGPDRPSTGSRLSVNVPAPVGFAAARESRAAARGKDGDGIERAIPSPVVMGFDIGNADPQQIQTVRILTFSMMVGRTDMHQVRNTILLKEQQQALIAQRRRDGLTTPVTASGTEHGWPNWQAETEEDNAGRKREKAREKAERLSIVPASYNAAGIERDHGSKVFPPRLSKLDADRLQSAPLNHPSMTQQQLTPREQSAHIAPQTSHPSSSHQSQQLAPPKAQIDRHPRTAHPSSAANIQQQQQQEYAWEHRHRERERERDYLHPIHSGRPPTSAHHDRRIVSVPSIAPSRSHSNGGHHEGRIPQSPYHLPEPNVQNGGPPSSASRQAFLAPFASWYDNMHDTRTLRGQLLDLVTRGEDHMLRQEKLAADMSDHYRRSVHLLTTLQESSESLMQMVKREVAIVRQDYEKEIQSWRRRCEELSERLGEKDGGR